MVQPVVGVTSEVTALEKKWSNRGGIHQRSHLSWEKKWSNPEEKKKSNRSGSQQRSHCLGKKMVQPVVGVNSEVTVLDPLKRFHTLSDQLTKSIVSAPVELSVDLGVLGVHTVKHQLRASSSMTPPTTPGDRGADRTSLATIRNYGTQKPGDGRKTCKYESWYLALAWSYVMV